MMKITREQLINDLSKRSGFYKYSIRELLDCLDEVVGDYFSEIDENNEVTVPIITGVKIGGKLMPVRNRKSPKDQSDIVVKPSIKPFTKFSDKFREDIQNNYEKNHGGNT